MDLAGIGPAFTLFPLELVELGNDIDGNAEMIVFEPVETTGIVQEHVGVEDEILNLVRRRLQAEFLNA